METFEQCHIHPTEEKTLKCQRCGESMCCKCAYEAEIGYWCASCHHGWIARQPKPKFRAQPVMRRYGVLGIFMGIILFAWFSGYYSLGFTAIIYFLYLQK